MKKLLVVFGLILSFATVSAQAQTQTLHLKMHGVVKFEQTYSITCLSTNCPPSLPYFYVNLENAQSADGSLELNSLGIEQLATQLGVSVRPDYIQFQGMKLHEGDLVAIDMEVYYFTSINMYMGGKVIAIEPLR